MTRLFPWYQHNWSYDLDLGVCLANIFWTPSARHFILHIRVSSDNCFLWIPACFDTVALIFKFALLFENFNLVNNFHQWVLELSYCRMWAFIVTRSLCVYMYVCVGGGCISQSSTHLVGFLSFALYFSVLSRIYILLVVFIFLYTFLYESLLSRAFTISARTLSLSLSLSLSAYK